MYLLSEFKKHNTAKIHATNALNTAGTAITGATVLSAIRPGSKISNALANGSNLGKIGIAAAGAYGAKKTIDSMRSKKRKKKLFI